MRKTTKLSVNFLMIHNKTQTVKKLNLKNSITGGEIDSWNKLKDEIETKIVDAAEKTDDQPPVNEQIQKISQNMSKEEEQKILDIVKTHTTGLKDTQSTNNEKNLADSVLKSASKENIPSSFTNYKKQTQTQNSNLNDVYNAATKIKSQDNTFKIATSNMPETMGSGQIRYELSKLKSEKDSTLGELKQIQQQKEIVIFFEHHQFYFLMESLI